MSLEPAGERWRSRAGDLYRLCENYSKQKVCNWAVPVESGEALCASCRLTSVIPDLGVDGNREKWFRLEAAKCRLLYSLNRLNLPLTGKGGEDGMDVRFEFLADSPQPDGPKVLTGHSAGRITVNVAEANDAEREKRRVAMHEPYRTLLGHFRHEIGHYYWDRLIDKSERLEPCRALFGDERADYAEALQRHYKQGPPSDWQLHYVSAYASTHPWEDWAESWAHYFAYHRRPGNSGRERPLAAAATGRRARSDAS